MKKTKKIALFLAITMLIGLIHPIQVVQAATQKASLNKSKISIEAGSSTTLKLKNKKDVKSVTWTSSKKSIVTVSKSGKITAKKAGNAIITCKITYKNGKKQNLKCNVVVYTKYSGTNKDSVVGLWYSESYLRNVNVYPWYYYIEMTLYSNGTGKYIVYGCMDIEPSTDMSTDSNGILAERYIPSWSVNGNKVTMYIDGENDTYEYSPSKGTLTSVDDSRIGFSRKKPPIPGGCEYMTRVYDIVNRNQIEQQKLIAKVLGTWYFDLTVWEFYEDGSGVLHIPQMGISEEQNRKFTYEVHDGGDYDSILMFIDFEGKDGSDGYIITVEDDGSLLFGGSGMRFTRRFDAGNCPILDQYIKNKLKVITGEVVLDFLSDKLN